MSYFGNAPYREWAEAVGVDPYTTNPLLREELERVAVLDTAVSVGTGMVTPQLPETLGLIPRVSRTAYKKDWRELFDDNRKAMQAMGTDPAVIERFEHNDALTPSVMTLIVTALESMKDVQDRRYVIEQASLLQSETEALFFAECVLMAQWFHDNEARLEQMLLETYIPVAMTVDGRVIAFSAADYAYWDKLNASIANEFTAHYKKYPGRREVWVADKASPRFVEGLKELVGLATSSARNSELLQ